MIDAFVDALDLAGLGLGDVEPAATGRPAFHPLVLLKLYIHGYLIRVQSMRTVASGSAELSTMSWLLWKSQPSG